MKKIGIVVGTRPEAIKMAPLLFELRGRKGVEVTLIATAQHRSMLDQVLELFEIKPDYDLDVMQHGQSLSSLTARILSKMQPVLEEVQPDALLVHGDTTTCFSAALAAFYLNIDVGHVEAGLRTHDLSAPWPEEMNRRLVDPISRWCFAPTARAQENLLAENIPEVGIHVTGNTVVDALAYVRQKAKDIPLEIRDLPVDWLGENKLILVTGHRRESFGKPFEAFCHALRDIALSNSDVTIVYPVHLNPSVREPVERILGGADRIHLIEPLGYLPFIKLVELCHLIITDSGGIQEEAPSFGKPVLVTRSVTERPEALEAGLAKLVGTSRSTIVSEVNRLLSDREAYAAMSSNKNPYGDGKASKRIVDILLSESLGIS